MPQRKLRMAGYIRESDPTLADSTTIDSAAKAVREYGEKQGYIYEPQHEYKEAISSTEFNYLQREKLQLLLDAAKRKEFDVVVITQVRALGRRQVEVFIIYDILQRAGIRLETIRERFEDDAMGRIVLSLHAGFAEIEREQIYARMQRGKRDRMEIGNAPPNGHAPYGFILVDSERETKAVYQFNTAITHVDTAGYEWSSHLVRRQILFLLLEGESLHGVCKYLNGLMIPPPKKPVKGIPTCTPSAIRRIAIDDINIGEVWVNKVKRVGRNIIRLPREQWKKLPLTAPALITREEYQQILDIIEHNKIDSRRNNKHEDLALLRSHVYCGICGSRMHVYYRTPEDASYKCLRKYANNHALYNHRTQIRQPRMDKLGMEAIKDALRHPETVRTTVNEWKNIQKPTGNEDITATIENIRRSMKNLYKLAENATDDETLAHLTERMQTLEKQKRDAERLLYKLENVQEEIDLIEKKVADFEIWVEKVGPLILTDEYTPTYTELRQIVRILGLKATIYPEKGDYPYRYNIVATVPDVLSIVEPSSNGWH